MAPHGVVSIHATYLREHIKYDSSWIVKEYLSNHHRNIYLNKNHAAIDLHQRHSWILIFLIFQTRNINEIFNVHIF